MRPSKKRKPCGEKVWVLAPSDLSVNGLPDQRLDLFLEECIEEVFKKNEYRQVVLRCENHRWLEREAAGDNTAVVSTITVASDDPDGCTTLLEDAKKLLTLLEKKNEENGYRRKTAEEMDKCIQNKTKEFDRMYTKDTPDKILHENVHVFMTKTVEEECLSGYDSDLDC